MATQVVYRCGRCNKSLGSPWMFDGLLSVAKDDTGNCPSCGGQAQLHLSFDFATSVHGRTRCRVLDAFFPDDSELETWSKGGQKITYYPFLVILELERGGGQAVWLPYWHLKSKRGSTTKRYGQWAPFMGIEIYQSLLEQARLRGYFKDQTV